MNGHFRLPGQDRRGSIDCPRRISGRGSSGRVRHVVLRKLVPLSDIGSSLEGFTGLRIKNSNYSLRVLLCLRNCSPC